MFRWQPLSPKQFSIFSWWNSESKYSDMDGIIADGSIRSGKTVAMGTSFIMWAMELFEGEQFAICGKTLLAHDNYEADESRYRKGTLAENRKKARRVLADKAYEAHLAEKICRMPTSYTTDIICRHSLVKMFLEL